MVSDQYKKPCIIEHSCSEPLSQSAVGRKTGHTGRCPVRTTQEIILTSRCHVNSCYSNQISADSCRIIISFFFFFFQLCMWYVSVDEGHVVTLSFRNFSLETQDVCEFDYVEVHDSSDTGAGRVLGRWDGLHVSASCGSEDKETIKNLRKTS